MGTPQQSRPTGVTILAVLMILVALSLLVGGLGTIVGVGVLGLVGIFDSPNISIFLPSLTIPFVGLIGIVLTILGLVGFLLAWGLWTGKSWAWIVAIIFAIIGIISNLVTLPAGIVGLILNGLIIYYLTRPAVKGYFGRNPVNAAVPD